MPGIFGISALTIGKLKYEMEAEILRKAHSNSKRVYDYNHALQLARKILKEETTRVGLTQTFSYPQQKDKN